MQRNKDSAVAWYNLGVKQQENERESKAIAALTRALALDDTHLPTWLALAISNTNEGNRTAADDAIEQWVRRNEQYAPIVRDFFERAEKLNGGTLESLSQARRHDELIHCLMAMVRSGNGAVDADVQVALAVLLNASEDYPKARDCFQAALSVRPDVSCFLQFFSVQRFLTNVLGLAIIQSCWSNIGEQWFLARSA